MNKYYSYPNIELWQDEKWADKVAPLSYLIEYMQEIGTIEESDYKPSFPVLGDLTKSPLYREKIHGIDDPAVMEELKKRGLYYLCTSQGGKIGFEKCWFAICPQRAIDEWKKLPCFIIFDKEDEHDPLWTMRAVKRQQKYVDALTKSMDFVLIVIVSEEVDQDRTYFNILQEISILFPCDIDHFYLDVSSVLNKGMKLADVENFRFVDRNGAEEDPDEKVEYFGEYQSPVLNIRGRWGNGDSLGRGLVMNYGMNAGRFDREWLVHSEVGKRMAQDMLYEYKYSYVEDPRMIREMEGKGLVYQIRYDDKGDRYIIAAPKQSVEEQEQLPVVVVFQEVYGGNEHLAVTAHSYAGEWLEIAAQGECIVIFFVLEDIVSNDRTVDIVKKTAEEFPIDLSRVYITGHSHDGYFAYAFANRNPEFVTAIAVMGMAACAFGMNEKPDYTQVHNIKNYDIPEITLTGLCESAFPVDEEDKLNRWVPLWKFTFNNMNIPERSTQEILDAFESDDYTQRTTCLAGDRFQTIWADGIEHYIVDFLNKENKAHMRIVRSQNMPHTITPFMCSLSWDFLRRFKKDSSKKGVIELY